jgi:hypothetical protein
LGLDLRYGIARIMRLVDVLELKTVTSRESKMFSVLITGAPSLGLPKCSEARSRKSPVKDFIFLTKGLLEEGKLGAGRELGHWRGIWSGEVRVGEGGHGGGKQSKCDYASYNNKPWLALTISKYTSNYPCLSPSLSSSTSVSTVHMRTHTSRPRIFGRAWKPHRVINGAFATFS